MASTTPWLFLISAHHGGHGAQVQRFAVGQVLDGRPRQKGGVDIYMEINGFGFGQHGAHLLCGAKFLLPSYHKTTVQKSRSRIFFPFLRRALYNTDKTFLR
ncbi:MAG: hypothetical protein ACLUZX_06250 [Subdoligranulum sp.]